MNIAVVEGDVKYQKLIKDKLIGNDWDLDFYKETTSFLKQFKRYDVIVVDEESDGRDLIRRFASECKAVFSLISSNPKKFSKDDINNSSIAALIDKAFPEKIIEWLRYTDAKLRISEYIKTENRNYDLIAYNSDLRTRVLIIDDQKDIVGILKNMIELISDEFLIETEGDGLSALKAIEEFRPQIVLLDLDIPKIDGIEVCQIIKQNPSTAYIDVLIISGFDQDGLEEMAKKAGAGMFVKKGTDIRQLVKGIEHFIKTTITKHALVS